MRANKKTRRLAMMGASAAALAVTAAGTASAAPAGLAAKTAATARTATAHTLAAAYTAPKRNLAVGMKGADVKALQQRLAALKYYPGTADGWFGGNTQAAVWAFQAVNGIHQSGVVDASTKRALVHPKSYKPASYSGRRATRIEVNQHLEVLVDYVNNKIMLISHVSTGGGYYYGAGARAVTPNGTYNTTVYMSGWVHVPLGEMYNPVFFIGTAYAVHGDTYVPVGPASHGCVRVPMDIAAFFHKMVKTPGTQVHVYGTAQWE
jgi:peptidoglycan hydrolase-like protein with peptidoglycan-binding domain